MEGLFDDGGCCQGRIVKQAVWALQFGSVVDNDAN